MYAFQAIIDRAQTPQHITWAVEGMIDGFHKGFVEQGFFAVSKLRDPRNSVSDCDQMFWALLDDGCVLLLLYYAHVYYASTATAKSGKIKTSHDNTRRSYRVYSLGPCDSESLLNPPPKNRVAPFNRRRFRTRRTRGRRAGSRLEVPL